MHPSLTFQRPVGCNRKLPRLTPLTNVQSSILPSALYSANQVARSLLDQISSEVTQPSKPAAGFARDDVVASLRNWSCSDNCGIRGIVDVLTIA